MATKQRPLIPPWGKGESYNPPTLEADLRRLKKFYFDRGFLETTVQQGQFQEDHEKNTVRIEILIEEGHPTTVEAMQLAGTLPPQLPVVVQLLSMLPLRPGAHLNRDDFEKSKSLLLTRLQDAGYARAQVIPQTEVDTEAHIATVTFTLEPGNHTLFGQITVSGEEKVSERAIRRQLLIREGQLYNAQRLTESADNIYNLGTFQAVTPRARNMEAAEDPLDIDFEVRERKPRTIQAGVGYSTVERFRLLVEWTHRNLFGDAQRLTLSGKLSSIEQKFETEFFLPYFLTRRTTFTQTLFVRNEKEVGTETLFPTEEAQPAFDLFSYGGITSLGRQFTRTLSGTTGLQYSNNVFSNVNVEALRAADQNPEIAEDNVLFVQFAETLWNTSDNVLSPTRGMQLRGRVEHANTAVLSDVSFVKLLFEARHYQPLWWQLLLATRFKVGSIQPYGESSEVPFNVRFFSGGPGSVRGFALNRLGPRDAADDPIGGNSLIEGSVELRFPIIGSLSGALFVDFGNVFAPPFTYQLDELRYAGGPGLRYNTPVGPIRVDVGVILDHRTGEDWGRIEFSIGQAF
jgi:outer membrane protein assembly complex protein YaeT